MKMIQKHDSGAAVEDVQQKLSALGCYPEASVDGIFEDETAHAVERFCEQSGIPVQDFVDEKVWAALVDASFELGDRTLYLKMPYFHGNDVKSLQNALSALGFACGELDGIFGAYTELALRKFQMNLGLPADGIAGMLTYRAIKNLHHSWEGKPSFSTPPQLGFARAARVLESNTICLFGTTEFTRSVASRMSNLSLATNPASRITSADSLLVKPDESMLIMHITVGDLPDTPDSTPVVTYEDEESLATRLAQAINVSAADSNRLTVVLPSEFWDKADAGRSAQHYAIGLLDALCTALATLQ